MKWKSRFLFLPLLSVIAATNLYGQTPEPATANNADNDDRTILMRNEFSGGLVLHSEGFGLTLRRAKQQTYKKKKYVEFDFVSMKNGKEVSSQNSIYSDATDFVYGKMNDFYIPRIGIGRQYVIFAKAHATGVEVRFNYSVGADLGITKPIYLNVVQGPYVTSSPPNPPTQYYNVVIQRSNPLDPNQSPENIYGTASFTYGLGQMSFYPGGYAKSAVSFEWAKFPDEIWALETGVVVDVFPQDVPIMAFIQNKQLFFNFYISLSYGGKW